MILIADSGSTKCDWLFVDANNQRIKTHTMGLNPYFHDAAHIDQKIKENKELFEASKYIEAVYFYGAGCSSDAKKQIVHDGLSDLFQNATTIKVDHDLTGAALATTNGAPGIACILGTGSNSCYFDGEKVHEKVPSLGYILGDEGSGSYFGKILLSNYLYHRLPTNIEAAFEATYGITKEQILENTYNKPNANVYLASFMRFISDNREHPFFKEMIYRGLSLFINIHVWCYEQFREVPVHFVGSIAYYFREVLEEIAGNHRFRMGNIEKRPVDALAEFHYKQHSKKPS